MIAQLDVAIKSVIGGLTCGDAPGRSVSAMANLTYPVPIAQKLT